MAKKNRNEDISMFELEDENKPERDYRETSGFPVEFFRERKSNTPHKTRHTETGADKKAKEEEKAEAARKRGKPVLARTNPDLYADGMASSSLAMLLGENIPALMEDPGLFAKLLSSEITQDYAIRREGRRISPGLDDGQSQVWDASSSNNDIREQLMDDDSSHALQVLEEEIEFQKFRYRRGLATGYADAVAEGGGTEAMVGRFEMSRASSGVLDIGARKRAETGVVGGPAGLVQALIDSGKIDRAVMAEALARIDIYIRSGWAHRDLSGNTQGLSQEDQEHTSTLIRLSKVISSRTDDLRFGLSGAEIDELTTALVGRLDTLCMSISISKDERASVVAKAEEGGTTLMSMIQNKTAGTGIVDVAMRGADGVSFFVGTVTSRSDLDSQKRQHTSHVGAIIRAIDEGNLPGFSGLDPSKVHITLHAAATLKDGQAAVDTLMWAFARAGTHWGQVNQGQMIADLELMKLFGVLHKGQSSSAPICRGYEAPVVAVLRTKLCSFGSMPTEFDQKKTTGQLAEEAADHISRQARMLSEASPYLSFAARGANNPNAQISQIMTNLSRSIVGMCQHFGAAPGMEDPADSAAVSASKRKVWDTLEENQEAILNIANHALARAGSGDVVNELLACASVLSGKSYTIKPVQHEGDQKEVVVCRLDPSVKEKSLEAHKIEGNRKKRYERLLSIASVDGQGVSLAQSTMGNVSPAVHAMSYWLDDEAVEMIAGLHNPSKLVQGSGQWSVDGVDIRRVGDLPKFKKWLGQHDDRPSAQAITRRRMKM